MRPNRSYLYELVWPKGKIPHLNFDLLEEKARWIILAKNTILVYFKDHHVPKYLQQFLPRYMIGVRIRKVDCSRDVAIRALMGLHKADYRYILKDTNSKCLRNKYRV